VELRRETKSPTTVRRTIPRVRGKIVPDLVVGPNGLTSYRADATLRQQAATGEPAVRGACFAHLPILTGKLQDIPKRIVDGERAARANAVHLGRLGVGRLRG